MKGEPKAEQARRSGHTGRKEHNGKDRNQGRKNPSQRNHAGKYHREEEERDTKRRTRTKEGTPAKDPMVETENRKDWKDESNEVDQDSRKEESSEKSAAKDIPKQRGTRSHEGGRRRRENPKATLGRRKKGSVQKRHPGDINKGGKPCNRPQWADENTRWRRRRSKRKQN